MLSVMFSFTHTRCRIFQIWGHVTARHVCTKAPVPTSGPLVTIPEIVPTPKESQLPPTPVNVLPDMMDHPVIMVSERDDHKISQ